MVETALTAIAAFVSTNVDDIFILIALFMQVSATLLKKDIRVGQYLGISTLIALSIVGSLIGIIVPKEYIGLLGLFPIYLGLKKLYTFFKKQQADDGDVELENVSSKKNISNVIIQTQILGVAAITIANGGDNIGIYVPLFATLTHYELLVTVIIFLMLTYCWLTLAQYFVSHPMLASALKKCQPIVFPVILIALGTYILVKNYTYTLFLFVNPT